MGHYVRDDIRFRLHKPDLVLQHLLDAHQRVVGGFVLQEQDVVVRVELRHADAGEDAFWGGILFVFRGEFSGIKTRKFDQN